MKTCVFAGTFDPITPGHEYVITKCLTVFDKVVVAVGDNKAKNPLFSLDERLDLIKQTFSNEPRVEVKQFNGMLVEFMKENNITVNVRGIRNQDDYKYETTMSRFNLDMYPELLTMYIPTPVELEYVSSSAVRNIISLKTDCSKYLPKAIYPYIKKKFSL
ncbi:MAG: pantetheine-phosphate adenylyltransferase [Clostridia bacterium]|nr:pantetheine-phosphate adenylyltransferase [Clostridia bacterium]